MQTPPNPTGDEPVQVENDPIAAAIAAAQKRAAAVYRNGAKTLIDQIPVDDLLTWDGSDEKAIVGKQKRS